MFGKTWHSTDCLTMHTVVIKSIALSEAVINVARLTIDFFFREDRNRELLENEVSDNCVAIGLPASE